MTTVATDGKSMAADSLTTAGNERVRVAEKVKRASDGRLFACAGPTADAMLFEKWIDGKAEKPDLSEDFSALVLTTEGQVFYYCRKLEPVEYMLPQTLGSGGEFAMGAMLAGASPSQAVAIACERDVKSGGPVSCLTLEPAVRAVA